MLTSTPPPWARTRVTQRLGIAYPIIQGPFGGLSTPKLVAAVSNAGGMGSYGAQGLTPAAITDTISQIRSLTTNPFAINLWVSTEDPAARTSGEAEFNRSLKAIAPLIESLGGTPPKYTPYSPTRFEDQARAIIDSRAPVFSFIFGIPPREMLDECRAKGIVTIGTATTPDEAAAIESAGADLVVASGFEAGGHRGSFLRPSEESLTGSFALIPQTVDRVRIPVIAAGGIADPRGIVAALALGAQAAQIGTAFLACDESGAHPRHRATILSGSAARTALTRGFTGRLARGVRNQLLETLSAPDAAPLPYPLQRHLVRHLTTLAENSGNTGLMSMWSGQSAGLARHTNAAELFADLVAGVSALFSYLAPKQVQPPSRTTPGSL